jgi:hypothetical protein
MAALEKIIVEKFSGIIFGFAIFWLSLVAYGLLNQ